MQDWRYACERAVERASRGDLGGIAAREAVLGLPLSVDSVKAQRVYDAVTAERNQKQFSLRKRNKPELDQNTTGFPDIDEQLNAGVSAGVLAGAAS